MSAHALTRSLKGLKRYSLHGAVAVALCFAQPEATAAPIVRQELDSASSSVRFGFDAPNPNLNMKGSLKKYSGSIMLDPEHVERSVVEISADLQSVALSPDQVLQAVFLQTALAHLRDRRPTFKSSSIERLARGNLLVEGTYTWRGKVRSTAVPVRPVKVSQNVTELLLTLDESTDHDDIPPELGMFGKGKLSGWVKAKLLFSRKDH